jgi:hypothetical protein
MLRNLALAIFEVALLALCLSIVIVAFLAA